MDRHARDWMTDWSTGKADAKTGEIKVEALQGQSGPHAFSEKEARSFFKQAQSIADNTSESYRDVKQLKSQSIYKDKFLKKLIDDATKALSKAVDLTQDLEVETEDLLEKK